MEQLVIFLLFVVASIVSSVIQNKKKQAEERREREAWGQPASAPPAPAQKPTLTSWPKSAADWQEQLKRMVESQLPPPVIKHVIKPVLIQKPPTAPPIGGSKRAQATFSQPEPEEISEGYVEYRNPLTQSAAARERAANLHAKVDERFRAMEKRTAAAIGTTGLKGLRGIQGTASKMEVMPKRGRPGAATLRRLRGNPAAVREAFVASLIFGVPKSLES